MSIRVMLANDHVLVRAGVVQLLGADQDIEIVAEESCGAALFSALRTTRVDVLLLDMLMPAAYGAEVITRIKSAHPDLRVLVLGMHDDILMVMRAMRAGASGYVTTYCTPQVLIGAIYKVATTGRYLDSDVAEKLAFAATSSGGSAAELLLSDRELQILPLIAQGICLKTIANKLSISEKTVSTHKSHILTKLGLKNTADLIRFAMQNDYSSPLSANDRDRVESAA